MKEQENALPRRRRRSPWIAFAGGAVAATGAWGVLWLTSTGLAIRLTVVESIRGPICHCDDCLRHYTGGPGPWYSHQAISGLDPPDEAWIALFGGIGIVTIGLLPIWGRGYRTGCRTCGYDTSGLRSRICPECGAEIPAKLPRTEL